MCSRPLVIELLGHKFYEDGIVVKSDRVHLTCSPGCCTRPYHCNVELFKEHYEDLLRKYRKDVHIDSVLASVRKES